MQLRNLARRTSAMVFEEEEDQTFVRIGRSSEPVEKPTPLPGPMADKFFAGGALAAFIGGAGLGVHLWLMLNGTMPVAQSYPAMREMHAVIQLYLFFGLFILGFLLQVGPRMLKLPVHPTRGAAALCAMLLIAAVLEVFAPFSVWPRVALFVPFVIVFVAFAGIVSRAKQEERLFLGVWMLISIGSFAAGAFLPLSQPDVALAFFWFAVCSIALAAGRQFIVGFLGGRRMTSQEIIALFFLFSVTGLLLIGHAYWSEPLFLRFAGVSSGLTFLGYFWWMRLGRSPVRMAQLGIGYSFFFAAVWMILGAAVLAFHQLADVSLHLWSIGWISSLVFGISAQMLRGLLKSFPLSELTMIFLICLWQTVPAGRAGGRIWGPSLAFPSTVAWSASIVLVVWGGAVLYAVAKASLNRRN